jgi:hypothetical protein
MIQGGVVMSAYSVHHDEPQHVEAGKLLAKRLHEAREKKGRLSCPVCHCIFDATHLIKCPECRTLIDETFTELFSEKISKKRKRRSPKAPSKQAFSRKRSSKVSERKASQHMLSPQEALENIQLELDFSLEG